jgi:PAS domain S-box-containing protein
MLGYPTEQVIGFEAVVFVHPDDRDEARERLRDVASAPGRSDSAVFRISTYRGATRWFDAEISNLLDVADVGAIVCKYRDVTQAREERLRSEQTLERLSRAIEQSADSIFITDAKGVIEYVNPAFEELTGYSADEAIGKTPRLLKSGHTPAHVYETLWRTLTAGKVFRNILVNKTKDDRVYDEDQTITPIRDESGTITHFVSTGRDVTQRRRMQEAMARLNHQLELQASRFAGILHDEAGQFLTAAHLTLADVSRGAAPELVGRLREVRHALVQIEDRLRSLSHEIHPEVIADQGLVNAVTLCIDAFARRTGVDVDITSSVERRFPIAVEVVLYRLVQEALTNIHRHSRAERVGVADRGAGHVALLGPRQRRRFRRRCSDRQAQRTPRHPVDAGSARGGGRHTRNSFEPRSGLGIAGHHTRRGLSAWRPAYCWPMIT